MDTSETYIKMRRVAIPFLEMGNPPKFSCGTEVCWQTTFVCTDIKGDFYYSSEDETFQLERQDQLQEMVRPIPKYGDKVSPYNLSWSFYQFVHQSNPKERGDTFEQLWLAFVMKEKFNKTWNGEDWI